jgi:cysteinyl-tRNA synthetase
LAKPVVSTSETGALEANGGDTGAAAGGPVSSGALSDADVEGLIAARIVAKKAKDFAESDRIRDQLAAAGVIVEDKPGGKSTWRRA